MVHHQHVGPIGQYRIPERSRFRWDTETYKMVSVTPGIEVIKEGGGGREEAHYNATIKIGVRTYWLRAQDESEYDQSGNQIFGYKNSRKTVGNRVWTEVHMDEILSRSSNNGGLLFENVPIKSMTDELTKIIMDFLSVDRYTAFETKSVRIIFRDREPITPKNYKVIQNV
jgi:hypothetical protein